MAATRKTTPTTARYLQKYYPDTPTDYEHFSTRAIATIKTVSRLLDLGAGAGIIPTLNWKGDDRIVHGLDPDPRVATNPFLHRAVRGDATQLPFDRSVFDAAICVNVMEHLPDPEQALREVHRVLKPGGLFILKTPNRNHYIGWIARLTPTGFHKWYNQLRGREADDTFETYYRFNRFQDVERIAGAAGFEIESLDAFEGIPEYLLLAAPLFYPGLWYERWVNSKPERKRYRANLEIILRKPAS